MKFRTEIDIKPSHIRLDPRKPVTLVGSCFSTNIGQRMRRSLWDARINPCGALYNPHTIGNTICNSLMPRQEQLRMIEESLVERDGIWLSWLFDSGISAPSREEYVERALAAFEDMKRSLMESQALIITYGTAMVYTRPSTGYNVVANCHKFPAKEFIRTRMNVDDIAMCARAVAAGLDNRLDHLKVIMTVSPVRHIGEGMEENTLSKATLLLSLEKIRKEMPSIEYFPAFEIMNDDLRDYRFYASDMVHPSEEGVEYIWENFCRRYISDSDRKYLHDGEKLYQRIHHRSLLPGSDTDKKFRAETKRLLMERGIDPQRIDAI